MVPFIVIVIVISIFFFPLPRGCVGVGEFLILELKKVEERARRRWWMMEGFTSTLSLIATVRIAQNRISYIFYMYIVLTVSTVQYVVDTQILPVTGYWKVKFDEWRWSEDQARWYDVLWCVGGADHKQLQPNTIDYHQWSYHPKLDPVQTTVRVSPGNDGHGVFNAMPIPLKEDGNLMMRKHCDVWWLSFARLFVQNLVSSRFLSFVVSL